MLRKQVHQLRTRPQLKITKIKTRCHAATHQRISVRLIYRSCKPAAMWDHQLKDLSQYRIGTDVVCLKLAIGMDNVHRNGRAGIEMPDFIGLDAVKSGKIFAFDEEVDAGGEATRARVAGGKGALREGLIAAIYFFEVAALRVGRHVEVVDPKRFILH